MDEGKGAVPFTYTADIGQYDEPDIASVRVEPANTARRPRALSTAQDRLWKRA